MVLSSTKLFALRMSLNNFPSFPLLLSGVIIAGIGGAELTRVLFTSLPEPEKAVRAAIVSSGLPLASSRLEEPVDWAPVFGSLQPEDFASLHEEPAEGVAATNLETERVPANYRLRGIIMEENRGLALLDSGNGTEIIHPGEELEGGWKLLQVRQDGILIERSGRHASIAFLEEEPAALQSTYISARNGDVRNGGTEPPVYATSGGESRSLPGALQAAHSRQPRPPRFFSMAN